MEGDAVRIEAERRSVEDEVVDRVRMGAELSRKRPIRAAAVHQDPEEDLRSRRVRRDLVQIALGIRRIEPDSLFVGVGDMFGLLDRVAVTETIGGNPQSEHQIKFVNRRDIETASLVDEQLQNFGIRIRLDGVIHFCEGES